MCHLGLAVAAGLCSAQAVWGHLCSRVMGLGRMHAIIQVLLLGGCCKDLLTVHSVMLGNVLSGFCLCQVHIRKCSRHNGGSAFIVRLWAAALLHCSGRPVAWLHAAVACVWGVVGALPAKQRPPAAGSVGFGNGFRHRQHVFTRVWRIALRLCACRPLRPVPTQPPCLAFCWLSRF